METKIHTDDKIKQIRNCKAENIINKGIKNKQFLRQTLLHYMKELHQTYAGVNKRKIQNIRDHNLIEVFKEEYPQEFEVALNKYVLKYGKDKKWKSKKK